MVADIAPRPSSIFKLDIENKYDGDTDVTIKMKITYTQKDIDHVKKMYFNRGYNKAYRVGTKHGKNCAYEICMVLGGQTGKPKGYYLALQDVIDNLEFKHKIGIHGAVGLVGKNGDICAECGKPIKIGLEGCYGLNEGKKNYTTTNAGDYLGTGGNGIGK